MRKAKVAVLALGTALLSTGIIQAGCSTGEADSLFNNGGSQFNGSGSSGNASSSSSSSGGGFIGAGGGTSSSSSSSSSSTSGGGSQGAGGAGTGGGGPVDLVVPCGNTTCSIENQSACCWTDDTAIGVCVQGPPDADNCDQSAQGAQSTRIECQVAAQCGAGMICCGDRTNSPNGTFYHQVTCQAACQDITMCKTLGATDAECPTQQTGQGPIQLVCKQSGLLPTGYYVCGFP